MNVSQDTLDRVMVVIVKTLGIDNRANRLDGSTELFGSMPELDSMSVVALAVNLEREFEFEIDDEDFRGEVFETIGTLAQFVEQQQRCEEEGVNHGDSAG